MDKLKLLLSSRKFWAALVGLVFMILKAWRLIFRWTLTNWRVLSSFWSPIFWAPRWRTVCGQIKNK